VPASTIPADRLARYDLLVATLPGVERKGVTVPYTSVNGNVQLPDPGWQPGPSARP
jgi:hypothetical protein